MTEYLIHVEHDEYSNHGNWSTIIEIQEGQIPEAVALAAAFYENTCCEITIPYEQALEIWTELQHTEVTTLDGWPNRFVMRTFDDPEMPGEPDYQQRYLFWLSLENETASAFGLGPCDEKGRTDKADNCWVALQPYARNEESAKELEAYTKEQLIEAILRATATGVPVHCHLSRG